MFGVAKLLESCGPDERGSAEFTSLYRELRLFEISRAVLLSKSTFLSSPAWVDSDVALRENCSAWNPTETVFDVLLQCTKFCHRSVFADLLSFPSY